MTLDGDTARLEFLDVQTGEHVVFDQFSIGSGWTEERFDVDSHQRDPSFPQALAYEPVPVDRL